jgi:hypothetical protein
LARSAYKLILAIGVVLANLSLVNLPASAQTYSNVNAVTLPGGWQWPNLCSNLNPVGSFCAGGTGTPVSSGAVNTTTTSAVTATGTQTVNVASVAGLATKQAVLIGGTNSESVVVTAVGTSSFTAGFKYTHATGASVTCCYISQTNGISTPSLDGQSMELSFVGPVLGSGQTTNVLAPYKVGANNNVTKYVGIYHVYFPTVSNIEAAEYDQFGFHSGHRFMQGSECDSPATSTGLWRIWNQAASSGGGGWVSTSAPCTILTTPNVWHTIQWNTHIDPITSTSCSGQPCMYYDSLIVDGTTYTLNLTEPSYTSSDPDNNGIQFQLDIGAAGGTGIEYVDEMSLTLSEIAYVAQTAQGTGNGTSCANAYGAAYINTLGNITAGSTYVTCGTWTGTAGQSAVINWSGGVTGTSSNPITLNIGGTTFTSPYWASNTGAIDIANSAYVVLTGGTPCGFIPGTGDEPSCTGIIENTANGDSGATCLTSCTYQQNSLGVYAVECQNCTVEDIGIYDIYVHLAYGTFTQQDTTHCVYFSGTNFILAHSTMHDNGFCIYSNYTNDTLYTVSNNELYNDEHDIVIAGAAYTLNTLVVSNNHMSSWGNWDCTPFADCHHDGLHIYNGSGGGVTNAYIYNNVCDLGTNGLGDGFNACLFLEGTSEGTPWTQAGTMYVFNNVITTATTTGPNGSAHGAVQLNIGTGNVVTNNTWLSADDAVGEQAFIYQNGGGTGTFSSIQNNGYGQVGQFVTWNGTASFTTSAASQCDHNVYVNSPGDGSGIWHWNTGGITTNSFSTWQGGGCDAHGSYTPTGSLVLNSTYVPQSGSALIGAGANLTSMCSGQPIPGLGALCADAAGSARPTSGVWDSGAYNHTGTVVTYTLTLSMSGNGQIVNSYNSGVCTNNTGTCTISGIPSGTNVILTQTAGVGYTFAGWGGACFGLAGCAVTMDANLSVSAVFSPPATTYTLTVTPTLGGGGSVSDSLGVIVDCTISSGICSGVLAAGLQDILRETPNTNYVFSRWSGACSGALSTCTITMSGGQTVGATWVANQASQPICTPASGTYNATFNASCTSSGSIQCFSFSTTPQTNGTNGCNVGMLYAGTIPVSASSTLRVVGGGTGFTDSFVTINTYVIHTIGGIGNGNTINAVEPPLPSGTDHTPYLAVLAQSNPLLSGQTLIIGLGGTNGFDQESGTAACAPSLTAGFTLWDAYVALYPSSMIPSSATEGGTNTYTSQCVFSQAQADAAAVPYVAGSFLPGQYVVVGGIYWIMSNNSYTSPSLDNTQICPATAALTGAGPVTDGPCTWTQSTVSSGAHAPAQDGYCGPSYPCGPSAGPNCYLANGSASIVINVNSLGPCTLTELYESQPIPTEPPIVAWQDTIAAGVIAHYAGKIGYIRFGWEGGEMSLIGIGSNLWPNYGSTSQQQRAQALSGIKLYDTFIMSQSPQMSVDFDLHSAASNDQTYADQEAQLAHDLCATAIGTNGYQVNDVLNLLGTGPNPFPFPLVSSNIAAGDWPYNFSRFATNACGQPMYHVLQTLTGSTPLDCAAGVSPGITGPLSPLPAGSTYCSAGFPGLLPFLVSLCQTGVDGGAVKICDHTFEMYPTAPTNNPNSGVGEQAWPAGDTLLMLDTTTYCQTNSAQCGTVNYQPYAIPYEAAAAAFLGLGYNIGNTSVSGTFTIK